MTQPNDGLFAWRSPDAVLPLIDKNVIAYVRQRYGCDHFIMTYKGIDPKTKQ